MYEFAPLEFTKSNERIRKFRGANSAMIYLIKDWDSPWSSPQLQE